MHKEIELTKNLFMHLTNAEKCGQHAMLHTAESTVATNPDLKAVYLEKAEYYATLAASAANNWLNLYKDITEQNVR